MLKAVKNFH